MRNLITYFVFFGGFAAIFLLTGCELFRTSPVATKEAVDAVQLDFMQRLAQMVVEKLITPEQFNIISQALAAVGKKVVETAQQTGYVVDWGSIGQEVAKLGGVAVASITGVNIMRNRARRLRGEVTGTTPATT